MTKLKIRVTKEILDRSKYCGSSIDNCAIAQAVRLIFPDACVSHQYIFPFSIPCSGTTAEIVAKLGVENIIKLPEEAYCFICDFDRNSVEDRPRMRELEFEVEISDQIIEKINIEELKPLLENHPTLQLIEN